VTGRQRLVGAALAAVAGISACGSGGGGVGDEVAGPLQDRVAAVREAAPRDRERAVLQLAALREEVARYRDAGDLSDEAAQRILDAADGVEDVLPAAGAALTTTTVPPTTAPPTPATAPAEEGDDDDEDDGGDEEGKGKGRGKGGDD